LGILKHPWYTLVAIIGIFSLMFPFSQITPAEAHTLQSHEICWDRTINWGDFVEFLFLEPPKSWTIPIGILLSLACQPQITNSPQSLRLCTTQVSGRETGGWVDKIQTDEGFNIGLWLSGLAFQHQEFEDSFDQIVGIPWGWPFLDTQVPLIFVTATELIAQEAHDGATYFTHPSIFEFPGLQDRSIISSDRKVFQLNPGTQYTSSIGGTEEQETAGQDEIFFPVGGHKIKRTAKGVRSDSADQFISVLDIFPPKITLEKPVVIVEANTHWGFDPRLDLEELGQVTVEDECDPNPVLKWDGPDHILLEIIEPNNNVTNAWFVQDDGYYEYGFPDSVRMGIEEILKKNGRHDLLAEDTEDLLSRLNKGTDVGTLLKVAIDSKLAFDKKIKVQNQIIKTKNRDILKATLPGKPINDAEVDKLIKERNSAVDESNKLSKNKKIAV